MSFYNVENPQRIVRSDPSYRVNKNISFLQSGFQQPDGDNTKAVLDDSQLIFFGLLYSPSNLINRYIERTGSAGFTTLEIIPSAFEIVYTLNQNQSIHTDSHLYDETPVRKGFYFDFSVYNETNHDIQFVPGEGVSYGFLPTGPVLHSDSIGVYRCTVTNATPATGAARVYINELSCCANESYPPIID